MDHVNESILNDEIKEHLKQNRTNHMQYLPDMEVIDSDILDKVVADMNSYDYDSYTAQDVQAALSHEHITPQDFRALLSPAALPFIEQIAQRAQKETRKHFGNSIYMFTPIYIANYCENYCIYCGFNCHNKIRRAQLNYDEIDKEMAAIAKSGLQEILILTGESRKKSTVEYIGEACKIAKKYFRVIGLEIYPLNSDEYAYLQKCGADYVTVFQETYNSDKYETLHLAGHKRVFPYRFYAQERALKGGMRGVGFAALLGLDDFRKDALATGMHAYYLQKKYPQAEIAFSCPRLRPIINNDKINPMDVHERQLLQVVCAYRLFMPFASITVSTRECSRVRNNLVNIAATKISAGVSTGIGEHSNENPEKDKGDAQFEISDTRSVDEVYNDLLKINLQPVMAEYIYV
ncbi:2-iminoacetate synthase ThiH [Megamonas hypermegale]|uniref:2-iminoacetate synthase ThiH n=1 Tax=Megamonas hypermegale TaxID=158847 RepID=UPI000B37DCD2|nr:2-iminoacetate synthase ThiH [Megamonas hypermegale]MBM6832814.1 2-iminoacetate synthase ThiH [Megamonas hypermegale]OUO41729.1 2-iminoacetate synthase ThiH [Megamonas hypermegale]HJG07090.1 2-iminoacetate synthase ThiH [Megamonas hypermegale]